MSGAEVWASFALDPRAEAHASLRAADADRALVGQVLADGYAEGRLDREEYDERSDRATAARTLGELPPVIADLVPEHAAAPGPRPSSLELATPTALRRRAEAAYASERRRALLSFLVPTLICWCVWVATSWDAGQFGGSFDPRFPWPIFVMLGTGFHLARLLASREEHLVREVERLEKQATALRHGRDDR